jgi:hypothetical protein
MVLRNVCWAEAQALYADVLALEIRDAADAFFRKELDTADVLTTYDGDRFASIDRNNEGWRVARAEIDFSACE